MRVRLGHKGVAGLKAVNGVEEIKRKGVNKKVFKFWER